MYKVFRSATQIPCDVNDEICEQIMKEMDKYHLSSNTTVMCLLRIILSSFVDSWSHMSHCVIIFNVLKLYSYVQ